MLEVWAFIGETAWELSRQSSLKYSTSYRSSATRNISNQSLIIIN